MSAARTIRRIAIVNRGEAAMRCIRAVKALRAAERSQLEVVALTTEPDRIAPFARHADDAFALPMRRGPVAAYLDHEGILRTLDLANADTVWPGWGFVAEDPVFADRVVASGRIFLGPSGNVMRALGDKIAAKQLAEKVGIPVTAWSGETLASEEAAFAHAERIGFPLVVKASAGGGGRGIRVVEDREHFATALRSAAAEALTAFGDDRLFLEKKVVGGRHVEVQIAADAYGRVLALGARDCSVQRRHQKLIEEAPPPGLAPDLLAKMEQASIALAARAGYRGLGTVEFLVAEGDCYFLEMNPRLQVEHGITEEVTGLDLVQLQIRIARGEALPERPPRARGVAIEARVCAEDPEAGFLPAPGYIARFEPTLGPRVRIDAGVAAGTVIPAEFDSLVAKVITTGKNRDEALARLACTLRDFELVIAGGASNKGILLEIVESAALRAGGVDTGWLDRFLGSGAPRAEYASEALVVAAILTYQRRRLDARRNFYADTANLTQAKLPASIGQHFDLSWRGTSHRLQVFAVGSWRYRIHLAGSVITATLQEDGAHAARLAIAGRTLRVLHDALETGLRVEVEGRPHRFGWQGAGEVRTGTPAMLVSVQVGVGDRVKRGQPLGLLEAMKMEIAFHAPISGVVREVCARPGRQVAAGDLLLVIEPGTEGAAQSNEELPLSLGPEPDPLAPLFRRTATGAFEEPDLSALAELSPELRSVATAAVREEIRRVLLGYDADQERGERLVAFLEADLPAGLPSEVLADLAEIRAELGTFADLEQLFIRTPRQSVSGEVGPSNNARLRMYMRRMRAEGAGLADEFLALLRTALEHYGIGDLRHGDAIERAVLRLFASQLAPDLRRRLVLGLIKRVRALAAAAFPLGADLALARALERIAGMRGLVLDPLADAAIEAHDEIFRRPELERAAARTSRKLESWLAAAEATLTAPPDDVLMDLAAAPREVFARVGGWLDDPDPRRRGIALAAQLRRLYGAVVPQCDRSSRAGGVRVDRLELPDGRLVLGAAAQGATAQGALAALLQTARDETSCPVDALELLISRVAPADRRTLAETLAELLPATLPAPRFTLSFLDGEGEAVCFTHALVDGATGELTHLHRLHPELAARVDLERLAAFALERIEDVGGVVAFHGRSRSIPEDERIFVQVDVRGCSAASPDGALDVPAFERAFHAATRALRAILGVRDPARRLQWNRISLFVSPAVRLDPGVAEQLARRLAPATRHLGLEKVVVRIELLEPGRTTARPAEIVISDRSGAPMELTLREPHNDPLRPASAYERKVAEARRRRIVYPYEIVRMLTGPGSGSGSGGGEGARARELPPGDFEEFDLDPGSMPPRARSVAGRAPGSNQSAVVFGIRRAATAAVPEGLRRVLILSDPTIGMGALAAPECDRIVAAIDLAERLSLPVEWVPVSSGAKIAMDSGTENLDATARVVRRIVTFTEAGGAIHLVVHGVNVGAQSYFDALATMLMHTRGALVMTPGGSMVLTGRAALTASGGVAAEDEVGIGGFERIMGPNGEAQYYARDLAEAFRVLDRHHEYATIVPGERAPRSLLSADPIDRSIADFPYAAENGEKFRCVGEIFDGAHNEGRKRPFSMRAVMRAVIDQDGGHLERWRAWVGAETAIVWDARLGGMPVCMIGIESRNLPREGYRPGDGPATWTGGTLFPLSSKKIARALYAASGNRPAVILANLSGFDGSPESMRKLQLEYGAEIARAVVCFEGPVVFLVVSRYHGGAYVVFSRALNPRLRAGALAGSYASVIGGGPAAAVVFSREVRARTSRDPRVQALRRALGPHPSAEARQAQDRVFEEVLLEKQAQLAAEFDAVHTVERACAVGSIDEIIPAEAVRPWLIRSLGGSAA